jgi:hypothetical protein
MDGFKIKTEVELTESDVESLLVSALEGGSRDWAMIEAKVDGKNDKANGCKYLSDYVLKGSGLVISNGTEESSDNKDFVKTVVNRQRVQVALELMAQQDPSAFNDIKSDDCDAVTGDIFLQICVLGKVIYG